MRRRRVSEERRKERGRVERKDVKERVKERKRGRRRVMR